jgi:hypothetical protein
MISTNKGSAKIDSLLAKALIASVVCSLSNSSFAFMYYSCPAGTNNPAVAWEPSELPVPLNAEITTFGSYATSSPALETLKSVVNTINTNNPSKASYALNFDDANVGIGNNENEIWWSIPGPGETALGRAYSQRSCVCIFWCNYDLEEIDIVMYDRSDWAPDIGTTGLVYSPDLYAFGGSNHSMQNTMMHELLHGFGLMHEGDEYNVMGSSQNYYNVNSVFQKIQIGEDAGQGLVYIYGAKSDDFEDVSVSTRKYNGFFTVPGQAAYATSAPVGVYNTSSMSLKPTTTNSNGESSYKVSNGEDITFEFTFENNGKNAQYVDVNFYLHTSSYIYPTIASSGSLNLGSTSMMLYIDEPNTYSFSATLPTGIPSGTEYWLGAYVETSASTDAVSFNNGGRIPLTFN